MNLICLDVDGVLCSHTSGYTLTPFNTINICPFNIYSVQLLKELVDCEIILHSTWRRKGSFQDLKQFFAHYGIFNLHHKIAISPRDSEVEGIGKLYKENLIYKTYEKILVIDNSLGLLRKLKNEFPEILYCCTNEYIGFAFEDFILCKFLLESSSQSSYSELLSGNFEFNKNRWEFNNEQFSRIQTSAGRNTKKA